MQRSFNIYFPVTACVCVCLFKINMIRFESLPSNSGLLTYSILLLILDYHPGQLWAIFHCWAFASPWTQSPPPFFSWCSFRLAPKSKCILCWISLQQNLFLIFLDQNRLKPVKSINWNSLSNFNHFIKFVVQLSFWSHTMMIFLKC